MKLHCLLGLISVLLWAGLVMSEEVSRLISAIFDVSSETIAALEWRKELVLHASFYGSVLATFLGVSHGSFVSYIIGAAWAFLCLWYSRKITVLVTEKEDIENRVRHRKMAGLFRSVVRSELERVKESSMTDYKS